MNARGYGLLIEVSKIFRNSTSDPSDCSAIRPRSAVASDPSFTSCPLTHILIERPTALPGGIANWVKTFRAGLMDVAMVPECERADVAAAVEARAAPALRQADGSYCADYVRLRFSMRKPG